MIEDPKINNVSILSEYKFKNKNLSNILYAQKMLQKRYLEKNKFSKF